MLQLAAKYRLFRIHLRRRKAKRRGGKLRLRIGNLRGFLHELNQRKIPYVVLRWFEEVPLTPEEEAAYQEDVDFLIDHDRVKELMEVASRHPGLVKCEFYSAAGKSGTASRGLPYYPPQFADEILAKRILYRDEFYIPDPAHHLLSLAFHLTYHKGPSSGIPTGTEAFPDQAGAKRPYGELLQKLATSLGTPLEEPLTLTSLHHYLRAHSWAMPYDLMLRWRREPEWAKHLAAAEEKELFTYAEQLPNLVIFFVRADASGDPVVREATVAMIKEKFDLLKTIPLDEAAVQRVLRSVRGGNWVEHHGRIQVPPALALICNDPNPTPFAPDDPRRKKYPLIDNANALYKNKVRSAINEQFPDDQHKRTVLHASDNTMEAHHHLYYLAGPDYAPLCEEFLGMMARE